METREIPTRTSYPIRRVRLAKYLNRPEDFMVIEWLEGVQQQLADALHLLGSNPIPLLEEDE